MKEYRLPARVEVVHAQCSCGGEYIQTGKAFPTDPFQYEHKCSGCNTVQKFINRYPYIDVRDDGVVQR